MEAFSYTSSSHGPFGDISVQDDSNFSALWLSNDELAYQFTKHEGGDPGIRTRRDVTSEFVQTTNVTDSP